MHKPKIKKLRFKGAVLHKLNTNLKLKKILISEALQENQYLIKLKYSGICGSQIGEIRGVKGKDKYLPHLLGHEGSGIVVDKNSNSEKIKIGDRVVLHWKSGRGKDAKVPKYLDNQKKTINAGKVTTFNSYAVVSENRITKLNPKTNLSYACLLGCSLTTAYGVLKNNARIKKGSDLIIYGAGAVGQSIICLSKIFYLNNIIIIDISKEKLKKAKFLGASHTFTPKEFELFLSKNPFVKKIQYAVDTTGNTKVIEFCYNNLSPKCKIILVGVPHYKKKIEIHTLPLHFGKQLIGSYGGNIQPSKDIPFLENLINKKKINVSKLIQTTIKLDKINSYINKMKKNLIISKIIIRF